MSQKPNFPWSQLLKEADERVFDNRLTEKKLDHGFLTSEEVEAFYKSIPEEREYSFTEDEALKSEI